MLKELKQEANLTYTENGAVTNRSTGRDCLDLFATVGALRRATEEDIVTSFLRAYTENADLAMTRGELAEQIKIVYEIE